MTRCWFRNFVTGYRCSLKVAHEGDHGAKCRLRRCGGHGQMHMWPS